MFKGTRLWRGVTAIGLLMLCLGIVAGQILETYRTPVDQALGTRSQLTVTDPAAGNGDDWTYKSEFETAEAAHNGFKAFALEEAQESFVLLKNPSNALPLKTGAKITMFGIRSYAPVYGSGMGSTVDSASVVDIGQAFAEKGLQVNPSMRAAYEKYFSNKSWQTSLFGDATIPEYGEVTDFKDPSELSLEKIAELNPDYDSDYGNYADAAVVVVGRPGSEGISGYNPGQPGLFRDVSTATGNILSLSAKETTLVAEAKANFDKVIVLVNAANPMEIAELEDDPQIDAILWIGFPGAYGFLSVADVLTGVVSPSGHLGDTMAKNSALAPAMANYGDIPWENAADFSLDATVNSYLIEAEGIYTGYRYYETRYADIVSGNGGAEASAGTYANADGTVATTGGTWDYNNEVVYPLGYGLSYTTFAQTLDAVEIGEDKRSATVTATVTNTGPVAGKDALQVYASTPYTDYDKQNGIEKSAIQLMDFEKTKLLQPGASQTITMQVDLALLASFDTFGAGTYIVDPGQYFLAIGDDVHEALDNVLQNATNAYSWTWQGDVDARTFAVSDTGVGVESRLSQGDYAVDYNAFEPGAITYLTRSDWDGTFPKTYSGFTANDEVSRLLGNDLIPLATDDDVSDLVFGDKVSELTLADLKGADFQDPRWAELVDKVTIEEFLNFAANSFRNIEAIPSVGLYQMGADDGPIGSESHSLTEGQFQGQAFPDAADYAYGVRVGPSPLNLAYTWNKELAYRNGEIVLGESTLVLNLPIMIGPGLNLHRHAYNARAVEYYSEDPVLSGYIASAVTQGAQSKGTVVNLKHLAFNDQETNRSGIAVFMSEQAARELELRNFQQAVEGKGEPSAFADVTDSYERGALGVMTSYNRIGAVASSANRAVMVDILRDEWGFQGYNITDFTGVTLTAAPKESILAGTGAFCGFGPTGVAYWTEADLSSDRAISLAIKNNLHNTLYALANSAAMNGLNPSTHTVNLLTPWRVAYLAFVAAGALIVVAGVVGYSVATVRANRQQKRGAQ